jgi:acyl carrier protein
MTHSEIRTAFLQELVSVAPDINPINVAEDDRLQDDLELDSMDFLTLVTAIHSRLGVDIAEADYPRIATLGDAVPFISERMG